MALGKCYCRVLRGGISYERGTPVGFRCRARRDQLEKFQSLLPKKGSRQGQNLALTVFDVPISLENGQGFRV